MHVAGSTRLFSLGMETKYNQLFSQPHLRRKLTVTGLSPNPGNSNGRPTSNQGVASRTLSSLTTTTTAVPPARCPTRLPPLLLLGFPSPQHLPQRVHVYMSHISRLPLPSISLVLTTDHTRVPRHPSVVKLAPLLSPLTQECTGQFDPMVRLIFDAGIMSLFNHGPF